MLLQGLYEEKLLKFLTHCYLQQRGHENYIQFTILHLLVKIWNPVLQHLFELNCVNKFICTQKVHFVIRYRSYGNYAL